MNDSGLTDEETLDLRWVMSDPRGRRALRRFIVKTGMYLSVFRARPSVLPGERVTFNSAQQEFGRRIQSDLLNVDPVGFQLMQSEAVAKRALDKRAGKIKDISEEADDLIAVESEEEISR